MDEYQLKVILEEVLMQLKVITVEIYSSDNIVEWDKKTFKKASK